MRTKRPQDPTLLPTETSAPKATTEEVKGNTGIPQVNSYVFQGPNGVKVTVSNTEPLTPQQIQEYMSAASAVSKKPTEKVSRWAGDLSGFGKFLSKHDIGREAVAKKFKITPAYVSMLAHGKATPALQLALDIMRWTREEGFDQEFGCEDWGL